MKKLLFDLGDPISGLGGIAGVPAHNVKLEVQNEEKRVVLDFINDDLLTKDLFKDNNKILDNLTESIASKSKTVTKATTEITFSNFKQISENFINIYKQKKLITNQQASRLSDYINNKGFVEFKKKLKKDLNNFKSDLRSKYEDYKRRNRSSQEIQQIVLDGEKGYQININNQQENSKKLTIHFFELEKQVKQLNSIYKDINDNLVYLNSTLKKLLAAQVSMSVASVISTIIGFFSLGWGFIGTVVSTTASIGLSIAISNIRTQRDVYLNNMKQLQKIFKPSKQNIGESVYEGYGYARNVIDGYALNIFSAAKNYKEGYFFKFAIEGSTKLLKSLFIHIPSLALDGLDIYTNANEIKQTNDVAVKINNFLSSIESKLIAISKEIDEIKKVEWVVIKETLQTDLYSNGGVGGKNLVFKNLSTGQVLNIDEMLKKSDIQLWLWNLRKVYNPKTKQFYIRKLPNHTKIDNLG
ncbi:hypothetical protein ACXYRQ_01620 [Mycoplasma sp. 394]